MTRITRPCRRRWRDERPASGAGAIAAALVLSSCSAVDQPDDTQLATQSALATSAVVNRPVGAPLQLVPATAFDWVDTAAAPMAPKVSGEDVVATVWAGLPLNTAPLMLAEADRRPETEALPLVDSEGRYHVPAAGSAADETPCRRGSGPDAVQVPCVAWDDQIAMAPMTVDDAMLAEERGGFITVGGYQINFGIHVETLINGVTQLTTALTLDDVINGGLDGIQIGQVTIGSGDVATDIVHNVELGNVNTLITNAQDDVDITTLATLAVDVINLQQPRIGRSFGASPRMSPELAQSIIRSIGQ